MTKSNSVFGPARSPIFDPAPTRGQAKRTRSNTIHEVVWSYPGDITAAGLHAAGKSPAWMPWARSFDMFGYGLLTFQREGYALLLGDNALSGDLQIQVTVHGLGPVGGGQIGPDDGAGYRAQASESPIEVTGGPTGPIVYVTAEVFNGAGTVLTDDVVGHGLTFIMWYRLL